MKQFNSTFYIIRFDNDETYVVTDPNWTEDCKHEFFRAVSKAICFSDCSNEHIVAIFYNGKEIEYTGWKPGMKYEYKDLDGNIVWCNCFPEWDH